MPQKYRYHERIPAALGAAALVAAALATGTGACRADDDSEGAYKKFFNRMLSGVGLRDPEPEIDYRERPPLVVPPSRDLPQPATDSSPAKGGAWPADPSGGKRRTGKAKTTDGSLIAGEKVDAAVPAGPTAVQQDSGGVWKSITTFGGTIGNTNESAQFVHEPARNALTDPPTGYRTPSPVQPYGIMPNKEKKSEPEKQADIINGPPAPK